MANDLSNFDTLLLSEEEQAYIIKECEKIAERITSDPCETTMDSIIGKYYELETLKQ